MTAQQVPPAIAGIAVVTVVTPALISGVEVVFWDSGGLHRTGEGRN